MEHTMHYNLEYWNTYTIFEVLKLKRKDKMQKQREKEIMVGMIIFVPAESNQCQYDNGWDDFDCIILGKAEHNHDCASHDTWYLIYDNLFHPGILMLCGDQ